MNEQAVYRCLDCAQMQWEHDLVLSMCHACGGDVEHVGTLIFGSLTAGDIAWAKQEALEADSPYIKQVYVEDDQIKCLSTSGTITTLASA